MGHTEFENATLPRQETTLAGENGSAQVPADVEGLECRLVALLEKMGEGIVLMEIRDLPALASLHADFELVCGLAAEASATAGLATVADAAARLVGQLILDECAAPESALGTLGDMIDFMRAALRDGHVPEIPAPWRGHGSPVADGGEAPVGAAPDIDHFTLDMGEPAVDTFSGDVELLNEFLQEAREHLAQADVHLLTLEAEPEHEEAISAVFRAFHTVKGAAGLLQLRAILSLSHVAESLLDQVRQGNIRMAGPVIDICFEATDGLRQLVEEQQAVLCGEPARHDAEWLGGLVGRLDVMARDHKKVQRVGEILVESGAASPESVARALQEQASAEVPRKLGEVLVADGAVNPRDAVEALRRQQEQRRPVAQARESIKVDADRLDLLVDLIGELVIAEAMVSQTPLDGEDAAAVLGRRLGQMDKITRELQSISMSLRMVPVRGTFQKMARLVRDLAKKQEKDVEFVTEGDDTELDKNVVDMVADPLMHMVRNSVDHGIESAEERVLAGKPRQAKVVLRAYHEGGGVYIDITDDGKGLDRQAILAKAVEKGLVQPGDDPPDSDVWALIFHPGFSTAKEITDVSGRGVGMDVVQRNINALHGRIEIRSERGQGSTFSIRLPLTLAIIDGMAVITGRERFIIPIGNVVRATRPQPGEVHTVHGRGEVLHQHDQLIPLFRLHALMDIPDAVRDPEQGIVLILEDAGRRIGLLADDLLGQQQVVIKPLGKGLGSVSGLAGGAIMPDGRVGLILDTAGLFQSARGADDRKGGMA